MSTFILVCDLINIRLGLINTWLDLIHSRLNLILTLLDLIHTQLDLIHMRIDHIHTRFDLTQNEASSHQHFCESFPLTQIPSGESILGSRSKKDRLLKNQ
jgi:hypothetical protein